MNISYAYLTLSLLTSSPILSYPISSIYSQKKFNNLYIKNLFTPFYYKSSLFHSSTLKKSTQSFMNSKFEHMLNRAITIDSDNTLSYQQPLGRSIFSLEFTHVDNCIFQSIRNPTNFGGALMTFSGLEIKNSKFIGCSASEGGALSCHEDFSMLHVTFYSCSATSQSGAFDRRTGNSKFSCDIELCEFTYCNSDYFGCFYNLNQQGKIKLKFNNLSQITAKQCVGCLETTTQSSNFEFNTITASSASVHNGCIVIRKTNSVNFNYCLFHKCSHSSFVSDAGAVLLYYDNPSDSYIKNSFFIFNKPSDSFTISVSSGFGKLKIFDSFFTGDRNKEINPNGNIDIDSSVKFNFKCDKSIFDTIDIDQNQKYGGNVINNWKNDFKSNLSNNTIGCLTINFDNNKVQINNNNDEDDSIDFFIIHLIALILAVFGAFLLQYITSCASKLYQSHKNSRENE